MVRMAGRALLMFATSTGCTRSTERLGVPPPGSGPSAIAAVSSPPAASPETASAPMHEAGKELLITDRAAAVDGGGSACTVWRELTPDDSNGTVRSIEKQAGWR